MYIGAGLSLLALVVTFVLRSAIRHQVRDASSSGTSGAEVDTAVSVALAVVAVSAVVSAVLWLLMARANGAGKKWARIVATILFGLNVLFTAGGLSQPRPVGSIVVSLLILTVGGYIVFLLWRPESSRYYDARSAHGGI